AVSTTQNEWYTLRAEYSGVNAKIWRSEPGGLETLLVSTTAAAPLNTGLARIEISAGDSTFHLDNIRILADEINNFHALTYNNANELTAMTGPNGTMSFGYDAWGRQTSKTQGSQSATYGYRYGSKLYSVTSNFPDEGSVTYNYG